MLVEFTRSDGSRISSAEIVAASEFSQSQPAILELGASEAARLGEPRLQLLEGCSYEYQLTEPGFILEEISGLVRRSRMAIGGLDRGQITTSLYVGTLHLRLLTRDGFEAAWGSVEVRSRKIDYRTEYRDMLSAIAEWAADLVGSMTGVASGRLELEAAVDNKTLQQRYFLLRSILKSRNFEQAMAQIKASPHSQLKAKEAERDVRRGVRPTARAQREIASRQRRIQLPPGHELAAGGLKSLPARVSFPENEITFDTPENRFVKELIDTNRQYVTDIKARYERALGIITARDAQLLAEMGQIVSDLEELLLAEPLRSSGRVTYLNVGSPVLQAKAGYREILRYWIMLQMATRLSWSGGDMVFGGARKNIATLYEYWCFVQVVGVLGEITQLPHDYKRHFISHTRGGLELNLARGRETAIRSCVERGGADLAIELSFNRTFKRETLRAEGSWTREMRPDMTLSVWPNEFTREQAFSHGLVSLVHFDAKYKSLLASLVSEPDPDQTDLTYSRDDLAKMHAYRDAIRRSEGAYILYPGNDMAAFAKYEEVLPGLGAIPLRPGDAGGAPDLKRIINEVLENCASRCSRRAVLAFAENQILDGTTRHLRPWWPYVGPTEDGDLEPLDPRDLRVLLFKGPHDDHPSRDGSALCVAVPVADVDDDLLACGFQGRLIFILEPSGPGALMRITAVSQRGSGTSAPLVVLECKPQPGSMAVELGNWLEQRAAAQTSVLGSYVI